MGRRINDRAEWIEFKGTSMIFFDYSKLKGDEYISQIKRNVEDVERIGKEHGGRGILLFVDITDLWFLH